MKIAAFYSDSPFAGWVQAEGFADVLRRMGHDVVPIPVPPNNQVTKAQVEKINKPIDDCELIIVSGPEWLKKWIDTFYPQWSSLKIPKVGWYHESFVRDDFTLDYKLYDPMFDFHFFPDKRDAAKYKGEFLPLGVDTKIFNPFWINDDEGLTKWIDVAFIGLMYPKRSQFVEQLKPHLGDITIEMRCAHRTPGGLIPAISVMDFDGLNIRRSMELLAETYRRIKVFVTFPSLSNVMVAKVLESTACGCTLVAPDNCGLPTDRYYAYSSPYSCAEAIRKALHTSLDCFQYVVDNHAMELRFDVIFQKVGVCASV